jgi:multidrug efflux pump subunit AcrB
LFSRSCGSAFHAFCGTFRRYDGTFLANYAYINLVDQLTRIPGIGNVQVFGAGQYAMRFSLLSLRISLTGSVAALSVSGCGS